ncbi:hypothetical protein IPM65_02175 [Candidatus Roizmanbacteria bacterium]|nr:MAG: hypothetical protein IPM65_02175 [Candidatus Roizmanbacteria bacterium]
METVQPKPSEQNNPYFQQLLAQAQEDLYNNPEEVKPNTARGLYWYYLVGQDIHTPPDSANRRKMLQLSQHLEATSPIVAAATQSLYDHAVRHEDLPDSPDRWYADGVEDAHQALTGMYAFFHQIQNKNPSPELAAFLQTWEDQLTLSVTEALAIYNALAIHLKSSPCAVFFDALELRFPKDRPRSQVFNELLPLWQASYQGQPNVLERYQSYLRKMLEKQQATNFTESIYMPAVVNVFDYREYLRTLKGFWSDIGSADPAKLRVHKEDNTTVISVSRNAHIFIRHTPDTKGQARINIAGNGDTFRKISYRVDQERDGKLGIDFCRVGYDELLKIAQGISQLDPALVNEYTHAVDSQGRMKAGVGPFYTPTLNRGIKELNAGHVFGMLAALGMQEGKGLGIQRGPTFNYHVSGVMDQFEGNFEQLSREFAGLFP